MDNRDKLLLQELLQESEITYELESLIAKYAKSEEADIGYVFRRLLQAIEEIKQAERAYLRAISIWHSRIRDMQSVLER